MTETKKPPLLLALYLNPTDDCNLACRHCWVNPALRKPEDPPLSEMPFEHIKKAIDEAIPLGLKTVKLTGGEPLLYGKFVELIRYLKQEKGLRLNIESNGTLVTSKIAAEIKKYVDFIGFSLDGAKAETHERMRVIKGSFDATINGIKNLVAVGIRPQIVFCITRWNKDELSDLVKLIKELGCRDMKINITNHVARGKKMEAEGEFLTIKEILDFYPRVLEIEKELNFRIFYSMPLAFKPLHRVIKEANQRCSIHRLIGIMGNGSISLCGIVRSVGDLSMGNIADTSLEKVWKENPILLKIREDVPEKLEGVCGNCIHKTSCLGKCLALNYYDTHCLTAPLKFCQDAFDEGLFPTTRLIKEPAHI